MGPLGVLGMQTAGSAIGGIMGLGLGELNDQRQLRQQQKLQELQIKGQKEMAAFNYQLQKGMWHETSYSGQVAEMKKAGINPALMYGMGGGGGSTTGSQGGNVAGAQAPQGGNEAMAMAGMGLQSAMNLKLLNAQANLMESETEKNKVEAAKTAGIDTTLAQSQNESILQGVDNLRQTHQLQKLEITLKNIENFEKQASQEDRLDYIEYQSKIAQKQMQILGNDKTISDETVQDNIKRIKAESIGAILKNILTQSQTDKTRSDIMVNNQEMRKMAQDIMINWDRLSNENQYLEIQKALMRWNTDPNREAINQALGAIGGILRMMPSTTISTTRQAQDGSYRTSTQTSH